MSKSLEDTLSRMAKALEPVLHEVLQEIEDDSDIYTIKEEREMNDNNTSNNN